MAATAIRSVSGHGLLGFFLVAFLAIGAVSAQPAPLNSAVLIFDRETLLAAPESVERVAALGDRRVMFVVTLHCRLTPEFQPTELGLMRNRGDSWNDPENFDPLTKELRDYYQEQLTVAFSRATQLGLDLAVLPHFDPAGEVLEWRNHYDFGPQDKYNGFSYENALIDSCLAAILKSANKGTRVEFSLSGEMGRSFFAHPSAYRALLSRVRRTLHPLPLSVGVSLNHNDIAGGHKPTPKEINEINGLVGACDFLGFSNYRPFTPPPRVSQFSDDCAAFLNAMALHGIKVAAETPLHFSEIGLGGAPDKNGGVSVDRAAAEPWEGVGRGPRNPWDSQPMTDLRRAYHDCLIEFMRTQPYERRVEAAYFWSEGSWDPMGVSQPRFADPVIVRRIKTHNAIAEGTGRD